MAIQCLLSNPELHTEGTDLRVLLPHRRHGQVNLRRRHPPGAPACPSPRSNRGQPCEGALRDGAKIPNTSFPDAVVVSFAASPPVSTLRPTPRSLWSWIVLTRWRRSRPSRSSFQTSRVSPSRSAFGQAANCGQDCDLSETRVSPYPSGVGTQLPPSSSRRAHCSVAGRLPRTGRRGSRRRDTSTTRTGE